MIIYNFFTLQPGKFLKFTKKNEDTEINLYLSNEPSTYTIFRIRPAFSYQIENATNLFFHLSISIACGNKSSTHEMCLVRNDPVKLSGDNIINQKNEKADDYASINDINYNEEIKLKSDERTRIDEKKPLDNNNKSHGEFISCGHSSMNRWKFFNYSNNYVDDDFYLNN